VTTACLYGALLGHFDGSDSIRRTGGCHDWGAQPDVTVGGPDLRRRARRIDDAQLALGTCTAVNEAGVATIAACARNEDERPEEGHPVWPMTEFDPSLLGGLIPPFRLEQYSASGRTTRNGKPPVVGQAGTAGGFPRPALA
jgi:hypothetical protein